MPLVLSLLVLAIAVGYARGGRLRRLAALDLRHTWLLALAVVTQLGVIGLRYVGREALDALAPALLALSLAAVLVFLGVNRHLPGVWFAFVGVALNTLVIVANGAMPVSPVAIGMVAEDATAFPAGKHMLLDESTLLPWLADVIPVPPLRSVISIGDVVLAVGVAHLVVATMGSGAPRTPPANRSCQGGADQGGVDAG